MPGPSIDVNAKKVSCRLIIIADLILQIPLFGFRNEHSRPEINYSWLNLHKREKGWFCEAHCRHYSKYSQNAWDRVDGLVNYLTIKIGHSVAFSVTEAESAGRGAGIVSRFGHDEHFGVPGVVGTGVGTKGGDEVVVRTDLDVGTTEVVVGSLASCVVRVAGKPPAVSTTKEVRVHTLAYTRRTAQKTMDRGCEWVNEWEKRRQAASI